MAAIFAAMHGVKTYLVFIFSVLCFSLTQAQKEFGGEEKILQTPVLHAGENAAEIIKKNMFVRVSAEKKSVFVGEQFLVVYKLYTTLNRDSRVSKEPSFNGCSVEELSADADPITEEFAGKIFHVIYIRKVLLTPLQEGELILDNATVENVVQFQDASDATKTENFSASLSNEPLKIEVNALPEKNKPNNFSGIVGNYSIEAKTDTGTSPVGENVHLIVTIKGQGNINAITLPQINWPAGVEHFDAADTQRVDQNSDTVTGYKVFNIPFIGTKEGTDTIAAIAFNFFDAASKTYKTIYTKPVSINFSKTLSIESNPQKIVSEDISNRRYLWIVPALAIFVGSVIFITSKLNKKKTEALKIKQALREKRKIEEEAMWNVRIATVKTDFSQNIAALENIHGEQQFFNDTKTLLTKILQEKFLQGNSSQKDLLAAIKNNNNETVVEQISQIYTACDLALYSPVISTERREEVLQQLKNLLENLGY